MLSPMMLHYGGHHTSSSEGIIAGLVLIGMAIMGIGISSGENRALEAAERAISHPLLDDINISGAKGVLMNITSNSDLTVQAKESFFRLTTKLPSTNGKRSSISLGTLKITSKSDTIALAKTAGDSPNLIIHSIDLISAKD